MLPVSFMSRSFERSFRCLHALSQLTPISFLIVVIRPDVTPLSCPWIDELAYGRKYSRHISNSPQVERQFARLPDNEIFLQKQMYLDEHGADEDIERYRSL